MQSFVISLSFSYNTIFSATLWLISEVKTQEEGYQEAKIVRERKHLYVDNQL